MSFDIKAKEVHYNKYYVKEVNLDPKTKDTEYNYNVPYSSKLIIDFTGKDINNIILNTLRRVIFDDIPTYAFASNLIVISQNSSVFNNDMMRNRLEQLPIPNIDNDLFFLEEKYWNTDIVSSLATGLREKHDKEKIIELYVNAKNTTKNILNVTTNDIKFFEETKEVNKYNKKCPIMLVQLRPNETFQCSMKAILGIGQQNNIWAAGNSYIDDHTTDDVKGEFINKDTDKTRITFTIESLGQLTEYDIFDKACNFIVSKLKTIKTTINQMVKNGEIVPESKNIILVLDNEDHTIGALVNDAFQDHPDITFSGVSKPDHFVRSIRFKIKGKSMLINIMLEQIDQLISKYEYIKILVKKFVK